MKPNQILQGDIREIAPTLPAQSVNCIVTSSPYWGLRDYGHSDQIGLEPTPEEYVQAMVGIFRELRRVLRDDGTLWLNLGDTYWGGKGQSGHGNPEKQAARVAAGVSLSSVAAHVAGQGKTRPQDASHPILKPKDLVGIPWRVALALQADGWYLRSDIIWSKPNPMPESVRDRPTKAHEYLFLLSKSERYYYDQGAIKEPVAQSTIGRGPVDFGGAKGRDYQPAPTDPNFRNGKEQWGRTFDYTVSCANGRNKRSVWTISTKPYSGAHFAVFPPDLIEPCILAGCPAHICGNCGAPVVRTTERVAGQSKAVRQTHEAHQARGGKGQKTSGTVGMSGGGRREGYTITTGWQTTCDCEVGFIPGVTLDPFFGSGTVAQVCIETGRNWLGVEINQEYIKLAEQRISGTQLPLIVPSGGVPANKQLYPNCYPTAPEQLSLIDGDGAN